MSNFTFEKDHPFWENREELTAWVRLLLPIERDVIRILYQASYPISAKEIVNVMVNTLWESAEKVWAENIAPIYVGMGGKGNVGDMMATEDKDILDVGDFKTLTVADVMVSEEQIKNHPLLKTIRIVLWQDTLFPGKVETTLLSLKGIYEGIDYSKPTYKIIDQKKSNLIKSGLVSIPDPRRIEGILHDLEALGMVASRSLTDRKAKTVYALNPKVYIIFKEFFKNSPQYEKPETPPPKKGTAEYTGEYTVVKCDFCEWSVVLSGNTSETLIKAIIEAHKNEVHAS